MIKDAPRAQKLSAIEVAEGALLADIAVLLQLVARYLPILDMLVRFLIPIALAVLVLRRRLYVGVLGMFVAGFVAMVLSGLSTVLPLSLSCGAGLFLGQAMKRRMRHIPLLLLGTTGGALALGVLVLVFILLAGLSLADMVQQLDRSYRVGMALIAWLADQVGASEWWLGSVAPALDQLARAALARWWALIPAVLWLSLLPAVILMYFTTNVAVRALGYAVRPFPGGRAERLIARLGRGLLGLGRRAGLLGRRRV